MSVNWSQSPWMREIIETAIDNVRRRGGRGIGGRYVMNDEDAQRVCEECLADMAEVVFVTNNDMIDKIEAVMRDRLQTYAVYP